LHSLIFVSSGTSIMPCVFFTLKAFFYETH
jgi:hypothetical protein